MTWKDHIDAALRRDTLRTLLAEGVPLERERVFQVGSSCYRADFACELREGGWLIIEDDDAQRALGNLCKYWYWMEEERYSEPLYLVHLIGPGLNSQKKLCHFAAKKAKIDFPHFNYFTIDVARWDDLEWVKDLHVTLDDLPQPRA